MPYKVFVNGFPLNASELNDYLQEQVIAVFDTSSARSAAITSPNQGQVTYLESTGKFQYWNGSAWTDLVPSPGTVSDKSANYAILATDAGNTIRSTGSAITVTVDNVLSVGQRVDFLQDGSGQITFSAGSGVTLQSKDSKLKTNKQYSAASVICVASGQYRLIGDLG